MTSARATWLIGAVVAVTTAGCLSDVQDLDWRLRFHAESDATRTNAVEVCIVEGPCPTGTLVCDDGARTRYRATFDFDGDVMPAMGAMRPPQLPRGHYAFVARARDSLCRVVATGCVDLDAPAASVEVVLDTARTVSADCCGAACRDGVCATSDAGPACADDGNPCTVVGCDAAGACIQRPLPDDAACDGPTAGECNTTVCRSGACVVVPARETLPCPDGDTNPCTTAVCTAGVCTSVATRDGTTCPDVDTNPCTAAACSAGTCTPIADPAMQGQPCPDPGTDPCRTGVCGSGLCYDLAPGPSGTACADDGNDCTIDECDGLGGCAHTYIGNGTQCLGRGYNWRCCGGGCVDIFTDRQNCGGCGLACAAGRACTNVGGLQGTACECAMGVECPGGATHWDCAGNSPGHCVCTSSMACAPDQSCQGTTRGMECAYNR